MKNNAHVHAMCNQRTAQHFLFASFGFVLEHRNIGISMSIPFALNGDGIHILGGFVNIAKATSVAITVHTVTLAFFTNIQIKIFYMAAELSS